MTYSFGSKDMNGSCRGVILEVLNLILKPSGMAYDVVSMTDKLDFCLYQSLSFIWYLSHIDSSFFKCCVPTVRDIVFGTGHCFWDSGYLCHFSTEMAEIWSLGTFFEDVWTHKISALCYLYFQTYESFSRNH